MLSEFPLLTIFMDNLLTGRHRQVHDTLGRVEGHVGLDLVHVGARGVAVQAALVAAQRGQDDVQVAIRVQIANEVGKGGLR